MSRLQKLIFVVEIKWHVIYQKPRVINNFMTLKMTELFIILSEIPGTLFHLDGKFNATQYYDVMN